MAKGIHKGCGGLIEEDWDITYPYDSDETGEYIDIPALRCTKCGEEIGSDWQIQIEEED